MHPMFPRSIESNGLCESEHVFSRHNLYFRNSVDAHRAHGIIAAAGLYDDLLYIPFGNMWRRAPNNGMGEGIAETYVSNIVPKPCTTSNINVSM